MLCEECKKKSASVHITKIVNNQKTERHLCEDCAALEHQINFGLAPDFSIHQFLSNLLNYEHPASTSIKVPLQREERCPQCGLTYDQFVQGGKMGCSSCYSTFDNRIGSLLKRIHGASAHVGKVPRRTGGKYRVQREITNLRNQLSEVIRREEFEAAAEIRDKIKELEKDINS